MRTILRAPLVLVASALALVVGGSLAAPPAFAAAAPPTHFTVGAISTSQMSLFWYRANGDASGYEVSNGNVSRIVLPSTGSTVSYVWGGMSPNQYMCFHIRTLSSAGASGWIPNGIQDSTYRCAFTPNANGDLLSLPLAGPDADIGFYGLHDDNFGYIKDDGPGGKGYSFSNSGSPYKYSLDFVAQPQEAEYVTAVRDGTVLAASNACDTVLVNSGSQWWVYLHLKPTVTSGMSVTRGSLLGELAAPYPPPKHINPNCPNEYSDAYHVHLAVANPTGKYTATYVTLQNMYFCGHPVRKTATGDVILEGLTIRTQQEFTVPRC